MNDRLTDLKLLIQNDRRIWVVAGAIVLAIIVLVVIGEGHDRPVRVVGDRVGRPSVSTDSAYQDLTTAFRTDLEQLKRSSQEQEQFTNRLAQEQQAFTEQAKGIFTGILDKLSDINRAIEKLEQQRVTQPVSGQGGEIDVRAVEEGAVAEPEQLDQIGFEEATVPPPPPPPGPKRVAVISPGDVAQLTLLGAVNAPVDGTPAPALFKLAGPVTGPDGSSLDIGEARLIAAATGSEADGRVLFRLTDLSFRHQDGRRGVVTVDGWIVGEDGVLGMKGRLIDKLGRLILATFGASFTAELGEQINQDAATVNIEDSEDISVNADELDSATASALTDSTNRLVQILLDRYEKLVPVVEILSGREVYAVFSKTSEISILEGEDEEGIYATSYSLD